MTDSASFAVRFHLNAIQRPSNAFRFSGPGTLRIESDFVFIDGNIHRSFRPSRAHTERVRMVDVCNVWTDGEEVVFDVEQVDRMQSIGFTVKEPETALAIVNALPERQTAAYAVEQAERDLFHARLDVHGSSTPVMWMLVVLNVALFLLMELTGARRGSGPHVAMELVQWGSNAGPYTLHGQWWRLVTSMFLHGGWPHILFNMVALLQIGGIVERMFGSLRFAALYMLAGVCGSLASVLWNPHVNSVGASGAIFGIIGGLLAFVLKPDSGVPLTIVRQLKSSALGFIVFNIAAGFIYPHTDNAAHLGGLLGGLVAGYVLARSLHGNEHKIKIGDRPGF